MFRRMTADQAVAAMYEAPETVLFPILSFLAQFGLGWGELRSELIAGRIVAYGKPNGSDYSDITISAQATLDWLRNPNTPPVLVGKVFETLEKKQTRN